MEYDICDECNGEGCSGCENKGRWLKMPDFWGGKMKNGTWQLEVPNTLTGRFFVELFRMYLNRRKYTIKVRGRHSNTVSLIKKDLRDKYARDVALKLSERMVIYIFEKPRINWQNEMRYR